MTISKKTKKSSVKTKDYIPTKKNLIEFLSLLGLAGLIMFFGDRINSSSFRRDVFKHLKPISKDNIGYKLLKAESKTIQDNPPIIVSGQTGRYGIGYTGKNRLWSKKITLKDFVLSSKDQKKAKN